MSALGQKQTLRGVRPMSALPPKADIRIASNYARRSSSATLAMFAAIRRASLRDAFNVLVRGFARLRVQYPRPTFRGAKAIAAAIRRSNTLDNALSANGRLAL